MKKQVQLLIMVGQFAIIFLSILTAALLRYNEATPMEYKNLFYVPLAYSICTFGLLFLSRYYYDKISILGAIGVYFLKDVMIPLFLMLGNYKILTANISILKYLDQAYFLMIYEMLVVFIGIVCMVYISKEEKTSDHIIFEKGTFLKLIVIFQVLIIVGILFRYPTLIERFHSIFEIGKPDPYIPVRSWRVHGSEPLGLVDTFMRSVFSVLQVVFPAYIINQIGNASNYNCRKTVIATVMIIVLLLSVMSGENSNTFFVIFTLMIIISILYFEKIKRLLPAMIIGVFLIGFLALLKKNTQSGEEVFFSISKSLNAYFGGPINIAAACSLDKGQFEYIGSDFVKTLPYISSLFKNSGLEESVILFNRAFWGFPGRRDQLLPSIGQGRLYFGNVFAPIIPLFFLILVVKLELLAKKEKRFFKKYFFYYAMVIGIMIMAGNNMAHFYRYVSRLLTIYFVFYLVKIKFPSERRIMTYEKR